MWLEVVFLLQLFRTNSYCDFFTVQSSQSARGSIITERDITNVLQFNRIRWLLLILGMNCAHFHEEKSYHYVGLCSFYDISHHQEKMRDSFSLVIIYGVPTFK